MDTSLSRWELAITKLVAQTQDGELKWEVVSPEEFLESEDYSGSALRLRKDGKTLILYRKGYSKKVTKVGIRRPMETKTVVDYIATLVFFDEKSKTISYEFPKTQLLEDLYESATYQSAGVDEFIDNLLMEKD